MVLEAQKRGLMWGNGGDRIVGESARNQGQRLPEFVNKKNISLLGWGFPRPLLPIVQLRGDKILFDSQRSCLWSLPWMASWSLLAV
jgi:hypothetical protein